MRSKICRFYVRTLQITLQKAVRDLKKSKPPKPKGATEIYGPKLFVFQRNLR